MVLVRGHNICFCCDKQEKYLFACQASKESISHSLFNFMTLLKTFISMFIFYDNCSGWICFPSTYYIFSWITVKLAHLSKALLALQIINQGFIKFSSLV